MLSKLTDISTSDEPRVFTGESVKQALRTAVRRGDASNAMYWAMVFMRNGFWNAGFKLLKTICLEDAPVQVKLPALVDQLFQQGNAEIKSKNLKLKADTPDNQVCFTTLATAVVDVVAAPKSQWLSNALTLSLKNLMDDVVARYRVAPLEGAGPPTSNDFSINAFKTAFLSSTSKMDDVSNVVPCLQDAYVKTLTEGLRLVLAQKSVQKMWNLIMAVCPPPAQPTMKILHAWSEEHAAPALAYALALVIFPMPFRFDQLESLEVETTLASLKDDQGNIKPCEMYNENDEGNSNEPNVNDPWSAAATKWLAEFDTTYKTDAAVPSMYGTNKAPAWPKTIGFAAISKYICESWKTLTSPQKTKEEKEEKKKEAQKAKKNVKKDEDNDDNNDDDEEVEEQPAKKAKKEVKKDDAKPKKKTETFVQLHRETSCLSIVEEVKYDPVQVLQQACYVTKPNGRQPCTLLGVWKPPSLTTAKDTTDVMDDEDDEKTVDNADMTGSDAWHGCTVQLRTGDKRSRALCQWWCNNLKNELNTAELKTISMRVLKFKEKYYVLSMSPYNELLPECSEETWKNPTTKEVETVNVIQVAPTMTACRTFQDFLHIEKSKMSHVTSDIIRKYLVALMFRSLVGLSNTSNSVILVRLHEGLTNGDIYSVDESISGKLPSKWALRLTKDFNKTLTFWFASHREFCLGVLDKWRKLLGQQQVQKLFMFDVTGRIGLLETMVRSNHTL